MPNTTERATATAPVGATSPQTSELATQLPDVTPTEYIQPSEIAFDAFAADYAEEIDQTFDLTEEETSLLQQSGFVVSDRIAFDQFSKAYAYIYWKDLPVLITTDSILHAVHQTSDELLMRIEATILAPQLAVFLTNVRQQLREDAAINNDPELAPIYDDLDIYLSVPLALMAASNEQADIHPDALPYIKLSREANEIGKIALPGRYEHQIDFTLFKPRGHYTEYERLRRYFMAMSWLGHVDFRFFGVSGVDVRSIAAAALLRDTIDRADQRKTWDEMERVLRMIVGQSDNMILPELDRLLSDANIGSPAEALHGTDPDALRALLERNTYGQSLIAGQPLKEGDVPTSFLVFGARFAIDSYVTNQLTFSQLIIERPFPSPLDVLYALGNERAKTHLQDELARYRYLDNLEYLRELIADLDLDFWQESTYNYRLGILRTLNAPTTDDSYPQTMHTAAWQDKMLHTQLASWSQLRNESILYVKQSYTSQPVCEYPKGYVEPYPEFYAAIQSYAGVGREMFAQLSFERIEEAEQLLHHLETTEDDPDSTTQQPFFGSPFGHVNGLQQKATTYFRHLEAVAQMLQAIAEKELQLIPLTPEEEAFLKDTAVLQYINLACAEGQEWNGWYPQLFPWEDEHPAVIADIHTNPNTDPELSPPGVLHVGTGPVAAIIFVAETDEGATMYVGPSFTYYDVLETGFPPHRLTDEDWKERLQTNPLPEPPAWTASFRVPTNEPPEYLSPDKVFKSEVTPAPVMPVPAPPPGD
ncbi:MAG: DUF3160 domain-containing protein [Chloroflexaceae bacterium]|nr:DUF3160 domain-containing protein [Chloroflexaceae bacterium]